MSQLPVPALLEAAHIIPDSHEEGTPELRNGICLSRIHHRAFDSNLIGIDADYKIHVSSKLLELTDGPILEDGIKALNGKTIEVPSNPDHRPEKAFLDRRFESFKEWSWPN